MRPFLYGGPASLETGAERAGRTEAAYGRAVEEAMWSNDITRLHEIARCICCCGEHTFDGCPARLWYGCRGQGAMTRAEEEEWADHYRTFHGMTREEFFA